MKPRSHLTTETYNNLSSQEITYFQNSNGSFTLFYLDKTRSTLWEFKFSSLTLSKEQMVNSKECCKYLVSFDITSKNYLLELKNPALENIADMVKEKTVIVDVFIMQRSSESSMSIVP